MIIIPIFKEIYFYLTKDSVLFLFTAVLSKVDTDKLQFISDEHCTPGSHLGISSSLIHKSIHILNKYILSIQEKNVLHTEVFNETLGHSQLQQIQGILEGLFISKMLGG